MWEFLVPKIYCPELRQIARNKVPIIIGYGKKSLEAVHVRTTVEQVEILGCERVLSDGHHQGFETEPIEFARVC